MSRSIVRHIACRTATAVVSAACLATMLVAATAAHAQGLYQSPAPNLPTGTTPQGVAAADFARSGFQSLVVTDSANANLKVYLATGPAAFAAGYTYATCTGPTAVLTPDLNNDGYPDLVVACPTSNTIDVFLNDGTGGFGAPTPVTATDPVAMVAGDFTGSGTVDVAAASGSGGVTVFLDVAGTLVIKNVAVSGTLSGIATGDFNRDNHLDLAVSDSANNNVHVLNGDGTGNFTSSGSYSAGTKPSGIATADFNHDGNLDLAVTNAGSNNVSMLLGSAAGTFTTQPNPQAAGIDPIAISVTDVNSDGYPDVVAFDAQNATSTTQGTVAVLLGDGNGTLQTPQISNLSDVPGTLAAVADFNRDGKPDLAFTQQSSNQVSLLLNNTLPTPYPGGRSYAAATAVASGNGNMADGIAAGDFNQDGRLDVAVSYLEDNAVRVLMNNGSGFNTAAVYPVGKQPYWIASGDLNGDGYPDLVTANTADSTVSVLMNNGKAGNGTFAAAATYTVGRDPYQVAIGDVNGDGYPDLAVTNYGAGTVSILLGSKAGTFTPAAATLPTCVNPYGVAIGDFEHNGRPSIAVDCFGSAELEVFPNTGNGTFGTPFITGTDKNPASLVVGDFNRDGKLDIVVGNSIANDVSFFAGNGDNTFAAGVISPSFNFPDSIAAGDINGDGILDIVGVAPNFNVVQVSLGKGDGTFGTFQQRAAGQFAAGKQPWAVALGDFNNDGLLDIVTADTYNTVNIALPAYQQMYIKEYPPVAGGHPSVDLLSNISAARISFTTSPASPLPFNNTGTTITATVQPARSGPTPTGSVIFENAVGAPLGTGPYTLTDGTTSAPTGRLGSGQYQFATLYSGDARFQPTTASGAAFAITVAGTPVTLTLNPSTVQFAKTFNATVSATGTAGLGAPVGTATIYEVSGNNTIVVHTVTLTASGNNATGTVTFTAVDPDFNVGTYQLYAYYTPTNGNYQPGSSSNVMLTVTPEPTSLGIACRGGFLSPINCTATVTASTTNFPVPAGNIVNFSVDGGTPTTETIGANGQATFSFNALLQLSTITATFPQQSNYLASTNSTTVFCFLCVLARTNPSTINSFSGLGFNTQGANRNARLNARGTVPFSMF